MEKKVENFASATSIASKAKTDSPLLCLNPQLIRALLDGHEWAGTVTDLAALLAQPSGSTAPSAAHLAIWLRRHEPPGSCANAPFRRTSPSSGARLILGRRLTSFRSLAKASSLVL